MYVLYIYLFICRMKFRFCGGLDAPDWLLTEIAIVAKLSSQQMTFFTEQVIKQLLGKNLAYDKLEKLSQMVKFTRSGGEANAVAVRIARASTKKQKIAVCGYHGWHDWYLAANLISKDRLNNHFIKGISPRGVPNELAGSTLTFQYNNFEKLEKLIRNNPEIGIIKMEVARNYEPKNNFLQKIRELSLQKGIILIFDECSSGFRQSYGGLHKFYGVEPDIAIFGKALGNGYAINAIIGKKKYMRFAEKTFISSTFSMIRSTLLPWITIYRKGCITNNISAYVNEF